jgi:hypothetical protein
MARHTPIRLIKIGKSLYFRVPVNIVRANSLKAGDMIMPDFDTFKLVTPEDLATLNEELGKAETAVYEAMP